MISIITRRVGHQHDHAHALKEGLTQLGVPCQLMMNSLQMRVRMAACWGWRMGRMIRGQGADVLVMERGYLGDRFSWTSLGWNGLNGYADFGNVPQDGGKRFEKYHGHLMKPWKTDGDYVLVIGQVPGDASLKGQNMLPWYCKTAVQAGRNFNLPVVFRPHPMAMRKGLRMNIPSVRLHTGELSHALERAAVCVTFNSNTAVDAVLAGVPTVALDRGTMAYSICSHDLGQPLVRPDRWRWASELAWKQWSIDEIRSGDAIARFPQFRRVAA